MPQFGEWKYSVDPDGTRLAYRQVARGGTDTCGCNGCRNFTAARERVFPAQFLALLDELGVDPLKDGEVYRAARLAPGRHTYGGWYHFIGSLDETGDFPRVNFGPPDLSAWMCRAHAPRLSSLRDKPTVELQFTIEAVPWLLDEPEPAN
jgi:hypothetical protein